VPKLICTYHKQFSYLYTGRMG